MTHVANEVMIGLVLGFGFLASLASLIAIAGPPAAEQQPAQQAPAHARTRCGGDGSQWFRNCIEVSPGILRCKGARYADKERGECLGRSEESRRLCWDAQQRRSVPLPP